MRLKPIRVVLSAAALCAVAVPARAQLFGLAPEGARENERDVYRLRVRQEVTGLLGNLKAAWDRDDARKAAELYVREGVLVTGAGDEARSKPAVLARLEQLLPTAGPLQFSLQDFDTSGDMAFVRGTMSYAPADGAAPLTETYVLIAKRQRGDEWLIRSLTMSAAPPAPAAPAAVPAAATTGG
jgi:uncharacterized protein (TIGR02246 family)